MKWKPWVSPQRRLDRNLRESRTIVNLYPRNVCSRQCICINVISAYTVDVIYGYVTINIISIIITILIGCIWSINKQSNLYVLTQVHLVHALSWLVNREFLELLRIIPRTCRNMYRPEPSTDQHNCASPVAPVALPAAKLRMVSSPHVCNGTDDHLPEPMMAML